MTAFADFSWRFIRAAVTRIVAKDVDLTVEGGENMPSRGGVLLCCNHEHHLLDGAILMSLSRRPTHLVVAGDWATNGVSGVVMPRLNRAARWPIVDRTSAKSAAARNRLAVRQVADLLCEGRVVIIFPEGYPAVDPHGSRKSAGELLPFHHGIELMARDAGRRIGKDVPILPVGLHYQTVENDRWKVRLRYGDVRTGMDATSERLQADVKRLAT